MSRSHWSIVNWFIGCFNLFSWSIFTCRIIFSRFVLWLVIVWHHHHILLILHIHEHILHHLLLLLLLLIHLKHTSVILELAGHHHLHYHILISIHLGNLLILHHVRPLLLIVNLHLITISRIIKLHVVWLGWHWHSHLLAFCHLSLSIKLLFGRVMDKEAFITISAFSIYSNQKN